MSWLVSSVCPPKVYMYAAWKGWTIPMFLFLALLRLSLNYLIARSLALRCLFSANHMGPPNLPELLLNYLPWHTHTHLKPWLGSHWEVWYLHVWWAFTDIYLCVPMMHCSQGLEDSVEHRTWSLRARGEDLMKPRRRVWSHVEGHLLMLLGLWCFQEPPKEDLTVSEKFQLVLDVAQRAQVRCHGQSKAWFNIWPGHWTDLHNFQLPS